MTFGMLFRRDKNFWDYSLYVNPLNPAALNPAGSLTTGCYVGPPTTAFPQGAPSYCSKPAVAANQFAALPGLGAADAGLRRYAAATIEIRFRLGYSRNRDEGPGLFTTDGGTISAFNENYSYTTNAYRVGVDFRVLPRTTISFDEYLSYYQPGQRDRR